MALVSVIIPNYNHARFLQRRIQSILNQTFQDVELIILDDASTDNSREIIEKYRRHPKLAAIVYNETNSGSPFKQWVKGITIATGEWVWIAESDDDCEPGFLLSLTDAFTTANAVLAYAEITWTDESKKVIKQATEAPAKWYKGNEFLQQKMVFQDHLVNAGMAVFKRLAFEKVDPSWLNMKQAGDYWFWCEIAAQGKVYACGKPLCYFTRHKGATSNLYLETELHHVENLRVLDQMIKRKSINKKLLKKYFFSKLVELDTQKKAHPRYKPLSAFWLKEAQVRKIESSNFSIKLSSFWARLNHFLRSAFIRKPYA